MSKADESSEEVVEGVYKHVWDAVVYINIKLEFWEQLCCTRERVEELNKSAPDAMGLIQRVLLDDIILSLARVFDNESTGRFCNMSILYLKSKIEEDVEYAGVVQRVNELLGEAPLPELRAHRKKVLAYADVEHIATKSDTGMRHGMPRELLSAAQEILNTLGEYLGKGPTVWDMPSSRYWADRLVRRLNDGLTLSKERRWLSSKLLHDWAAGDPWAYPQLVELGGHKGLSV